MKITLYTITDCQFSKQEKEYLSSHGLQFEEKNLETNREFLTEMLAVGSNFAGTPVTKIEKDDGQIVVLKGFTLAEFDKTLGFEVKTTPTVPQTEKPPVVEQVQTPQALPQVEETPLVETPQVPTPPPVPVENPAMTSLLNNLEQQAQVPATPTAPATQPPAVPVAPVAPIAPAPVAEQPTIPDPQF